MQTVYSITDILNLILLTAEAIQFLLLHDNGSLGGAVPSQPRTDFS